MTEAHSQEPAPESAAPSDPAAGHVVYAIFPDRFAPPDEDPAAHPDRFPPDAAFRKWHELPRRGPLDEGRGLCDHERAFWGGTLQGITKRLEYIQRLGATLLYLTPVTQGATNHRYDSISHPLAVDPALGSEGDLQALARGCHDQGIALALDVVPNHLGAGHPFFRQALADPASPYRDFFLFCPTAEDPDGCVYYFDVRNLPSVNLESGAARDYFYRGPDSVLMRHLSWGADALRVDSADLVGPAILGEMRAAVHEAKKDAWLVGEIWTYPGRMWLDAVDGGYNGYLGDLIVRVARGELAGGALGRAAERMVADAGLGYVLRSWITIANHDAHRLADQVPVAQQASVARALLFTLPGSPTLYYGDELGMRAHPRPGEESDPISRAPMRWDLVRDDNPVLFETRRLLALRRACPALRYGGYIAVETEALVAFLRPAPDVAGTALVVINPTSRPVRESLMLRDSRLLAFTTLVDRLGYGGRNRRLTTGKGLLDVDLGPYEALVLTPDVAPWPGGFARYRRAGYGPVP